MPPSVAAETSADKSLTMQQALAQQPQRTTMPERIAGWFAEADGIGSALDQVSEFLDMQLKEERRDPPTPLTIEQRLDTARVEKYEADVAEYEQWLAAMQSRLRAKKGPFDVALMTVVAAGIRGRMYADSQQTRALIEFIEKQGRRPMFVPGDDMPTMAERVALPLEIIRKQRTASMQIANAKAEARGSTAQATGKQRPQFSAREDRVFGWLNDDASAAPKNRADEADDGVDVARRQRYVESLIGRTNNFTVIVEDIVTGMRDGGLENVFPALWQACEQASIDDIPTFLQTNLFPKVVGTNAEKLILLAKANARVNNEFFGGTVTKETAETDRQALATVVTALYGMASGNRAAAFKPRTSVASNVATPVPVSGARIRKGAALEEKLALQLALTNVPPKGGKVHGDSEAWGDRKPNGIPITNLPTGLSSLMIAIFSFTADGKMRINDEQIALYAAHAAQHGKAQEFIQTLQILVTHMVSDEASQQKLLDLLLAPVEGFHSLKKSLGTASRRRESRFGQALLKVRSQNGTQSATRLDAEHETPPAPHVKTPQPHLISLAKAREHVERAGDVTQATQALRHALSTHLRTTAEHFGVMIDGAQTVDGLVVETKRFVDFLQQVDYRRVVDGAQQGSSDRETASIFAQELDEAAQRAA